LGGGREGGREREREEYEDLSINYHKMIVQIPFLLKFRGNLDYLFEYYR